MKVSKNDRAGKLLGYRPRGTPIDQPCELGYRCPVCRNGWCLQWSEYETMVWCETCNFDYASCVCMPNKKKATEIYLDCVEHYKKRKK